MKRQTLSLLAFLAIATGPVGAVKAQQTAELLNNALRSRENGDFVSAERDFEQAVRIDPENASLWNYLCSTRILASKYKTAVDACDQALKLSTKYVFALGNRADAWTYLGDYDKAMIDINRALALNPSYLFGYQLRGWLNIYKQDGDMVQSSKDFQQVLRMSPDSSTAMTGLGIVQMDLKDAFGAIRWFDKAIAISPKYAYAYRSRGIAREMMGDMTGACKDWRQAKSYGNEQVVSWIEKQCR